MNLLFVQGPSASSRLVTAMYVPKRTHRNRAQFVQLVIERQSESGIFPNGIAVGA